MRRRMILAAIVSTIFVTFAALNFGQQTVDTSSIRPELEVMKSILSTTIELVTEKVAQASQEAGKRRPGGRSSGWINLRFYGEHASGEVEGFYLKGQGLVFTIQLPESAIFESPDLDAMRERIAEMRELERRSPQLLAVEMQMLERELAMTQAQVERDAARAARESLRYAQVLPEAPVPPEPPEPPAPPEQPEPPAPPKPTPAPRVRVAPERAREMSQEEVQREVHQFEERLARAEETLKESEEKAKQRREASLKLRGQIKDAVLEALSKHGDALTSLGADEYINVILTEDGGWISPGSSSENPAEVLSIRKRSILDFKAGRIDFNAFRSQVFEY